MLLKNRINHIFFPSTAWLLRIYPPANNKFKKPHVYLKNLLSYVVEITYSQIPAGPLGHSPIESTRKKNTKDGQARAQKEEIFSVFIL